jgi:sulfate permease, SulP family
MKGIKSYLPILQWLPNYKKEHLNGDLFAGLTVGIMLIPQGMAYALIAGLPPVYGLYASIVPQLIYAILGTSRQLSVAPVAMDSLLVASGVAVLAMEGTDAYISFAILLAFFMGVSQFLLGTFKMGFITNLLSKPVISGFTSAAALIIGLNQLKYLIGVDIAKSNKVYEIVANAFSKLDQTHLVTLLIGIAGIALIKGVKKINNKIPGALLAVVFGTLLVYFMGLDDKGVSIVKEIPEGLPPFKLPDFSLGQFAKLIPLALTISVVAFMEAFSVAKALESKKRNYKVIPNQELLALGASNIIGSLFQSYPVTGGFSRSAVNFQAGANTPLSSIISAVLVGLTLIFLTPLFYHLPHAILAAVIMVAIVGLIDLSYIRYLWKKDKVEFALLMVTFLVTLNFSMVPGIVSGIVFSILILMFKAAYPHVALLGKVKETQEFRNLDRFDDLMTWENLLIIRVDAPYAFINIQTIKERIIKEADDRKGELKYVILDASSVNYVDATGIDGLKELIKELEELKVQLVMSSVIGPVRDSFHKNGIFEEMNGNMFLNTDEAVKALVGKQVDFYPEHVNQVNL